MKDASWEIQKAVFARLTALGLWKVYDKPTVDARFPYLTISYFDINASCKTQSRQEFTVQVHCWSTYDGQKEIREMTDDVIQSITGSALALTGFTNPQWHYDGSTYLEEPDNGVKHAILNFKVLTLET